MTIPYKGRRSFHDGPWHFCSRCEDKTHISDMEWQRGLLLCPKCVDYGENPLVGDREAAILRAFEYPTHELEPDPKLTSPEAGGGGDGDEILF